jgi:hypothetical protein
VVVVVGGGAVVVVGGGGEVVVVGGGGEVVGAEPGTVVPGPGQVVVGLGAARPRPEGSLTLCCLPPDEPDVPSGPVAPLRELGTLPPPTRWSSEPRPDRLFVLGPPFSPPAARGVAEPTADG